MNTSASEQRWQRVAAEFGLLRDEREAALNAAADVEAERNDLAQWTVRACREAVAGVEAVLRGRVAEIRAATQLPLELGSRVSKSVGEATYGAEALHIALAPCRVDLYAVRGGDIPERLYFALTTWGQGPHPRMVSRPGCDLRRTQSGGFELRWSDSARRGLPATLESVADEALELLARACRAREAASAVVRRYRAVG